MDRPDVSLLYTHNWPASLLGCGGHRHILTPKLDQLAANGVRYKLIWCPVGNQRCVDCGASEAGADG